MERWKTLFFSWKEKWEDKKYSLYKFILMLLVHKIRNNFFYFTLYRESHFFLMIIRGESQPPFGFKEKKKKKKTFPKKKKKTTKKKKKKKKKPLLHSIKQTSVKKIKIKIKHMRIEKKKRRTMLTMRIDTVEAKLVSSHRLISFPFFPLKSLQIRNTRFWWAQWENTWTPPRFL